MTAHASSWASMEQQTFPLLVNCCGIPDVCVSLSLIHFLITEQKENAEPFLPECLLMSLLPFFLQNSPHLLTSPTVCLSHRTCVCLCCFMRVPTKFSANFRNTAKLKCKWAYIFISSLDMNKYFITSVRRKVLGKFYFIFASRPKGSYNPSNYQTLKSLLLHKNVHLLFIQHIPFFCCHILITTTPCHAINHSFSSLCYWGFIYFSYIYSTA